MADRAARASNLWQATAGPPLGAAPLAGDAVADVTVIGGGFTGCAAALRLAEAGATVRLLEAGEIGHGGSGRNVGLVNAGLWMPPDAVEDVLGAGAGGRLNAILGEGPEAVFSLIEAHGIECEATRTGTLHCAHSPAGLRKLAERHRQLAARGAPVELLGADETAAATGARGLHGALLDRRAGTIQPLAYVRGLARAAMSAGATLHEGSAARGIAREEGGWRVSTASGSVRSRALIVATNAYHAGIDLEPARQFIPVHFFQFATGPLESDLPDAILPGRHGCWDTATVMSSFRRDAAGRLVVGAIGSLDAAGAGVHRRWAERKLRKLFPQIGHRPFEYGWCGRIAMMPDHIPRVFAPGPGAVCVTGYSGRGIAPGTLFGRACADYVLNGDESALPLPLFAPPVTRLRSARGAWYETGATAFHLLTSRR